MSSIKNTEMEGSLSVGRNLTAGGGATIQGNVTIARNLNVGGWLEAKNIKGPGKGLFTSVESLKEAYPHPHEGWWALVGSTLPAELYVAEAGEWVDTGETAGEVTVDSQAYEEQVEALNSDLESLASDVETNSGSIASLQSALSSETAARESADASLQEDVDELQSRFSDTYQEITDARIGTDGTIYTTLGGAVRETSNAKFGRLTTPVQINSSNYEDYFTDANEVYDGTTYYIDPSAVILIANLPPYGFSSVTSVCAILSSFNALAIPGGSYQVCVYCQIGASVDQYFGAYIRKCYGTTNSYGWGDWRSLTADNIMAHKSVNVEDNAEWFKDSVIEPKYSGMSVAGLGSYFSEEYPLLSKGNFTSVVLEDCGNNNPTVLLFNSSYGAYLSHNGELTKLGFAGSGGNFTEDNEPLTSLKEAPLNSSYFLSYERCKNIIDDLPGTFTEGYGNLLTFDYSNTCNANGIGFQHGRCQIFMTSQNRLYFRHEHGTGSYQYWREWTEVGKQADMDMKYGRAGTTQISANNYEDYFTDANDVYDADSYYIQPGAVSLIDNLPPYGNKSHACVLLVFNTLNIPGGTIQIAVYVSGAENETNSYFAAYMRECFGTLSIGYNWTKWQSISDSTWSDRESRNAEDYPEYFHNGNVLHPFYKGFLTALSSYLDDDATANHTLDGPHQAIPLCGTGDSTDALFLSIDNGVYASYGGTLYKLGFTGVRGNSSTLNGYTSLKQLPINSCYFLNMNNLEKDSLPDDFPSGFPTSGYANVLTFSYSNSVSTSGYIGQHGLTQIIVTSSGELYHRFENGMNTYQVWSEWIEEAHQSDVDSLQEAVEELSDCNIKNSVYKHTARIFKTVGCVGDSYTSGHINIGNGTTTTNEDFAWPYYMSLITGQEWVNFGHSGARAGSTTNNWMNLSRGYAKAAAYGICQAYVIGLGINDANNDVTVGDTTSIDDSDQTTYMGGLRVIIDALRELSPDCYIFVQSMPRTGSTYLTFNQAMEDTVAYLRDTLGYTHIHYLDLHEYVEMYTNTNLAQDYIQGHYTAQGYEIFAENLEYIMSEYINENYNDFQDVYIQPWEATSAISLTSLEDDSVDEFVGDENEGWDMSETE